jgi:Flp pilus assembly protein TadD
LEAILSNYYFGIALFLIIIGGRFAYERWHFSRFQRRWLQAQDAVHDGNWVAAEARLRECVKMTPIAGSVHRLLGVVLARRGKIAEAEERIRFGAELEPKNPQGFLELGFFLHAFAPDRKEEAIDAFASALKNAPNLRETLSNEPRLESLRECERFKKLLQS